MEIENSSNNPYFILTGNNFIFHPTTEVINEIKKLPKHTPKEYPFGDKFYTIYSRFYHWLVKESHPNIDPLFGELPVDRKFLEKIYCDNFFLGYQYFNEKYSAKYEHGNIAMVRNLKSIYDDEIVPLHTPEQSDVIDRKTFEDRAFSFGWLFGFEKLAFEYRADFKRFFADLHEIYSEKELPKNEKKPVRELPAKNFKLKDGVTSERIIDIYKWCVETRRIPNNYPMDYFTAFFSNEPLPTNWDPIPWILKNITGKKAGKPNATALAAILLELTTVKKSNQQIEAMKWYFVDLNGSAILPNLRAYNWEMYLP